MYKVEFTKKAEKHLLKLPMVYQERIRNRIDNLVENPLSGKSLEGEYKGLYSLRVWPYRIIYKILKQKLIIEVIEIKHRQGAYKNLSH